MVVDVAVAVWSCYERQGILFNVLLGQFQLGNGRAVESQGEIGKMRGPCQPFDHQWIGIALDGKKGGYRIIINVIIVILFLCTRVKKPTKQD